ncbi:nuclear cap-binding protein subunit 1-B-like [Rhopilema esculentum]|uniref:nuclear cap-binding protein subunit 1-B-like n=1 Tax=Rhopilema esculentum TaxID=499914 RepID=UPI0031E384A6
MDRKRYRNFDPDNDSREKKRRRPEPIDVEDRLESLITRVGEKSTSSLKSNLDGLAAVLETDIPNYKDLILRILSTCISNLPEKITIYSTLVGLLNEKNFDFGGELLEMAIRNLEDMMAAQQFERARLMVRFISDLLNCNFLVATSLISFLENFINMAGQPNIPQVRSDWFVYIVLSSLPWCGKELASKRGKELERLLSALEEIISKRSKRHTKALRVWSTDDPHPQEEYIDCLWAQIEKMKSDGWEEKHIRRPYIEFHAVLCKAMPHPIPPFKIPPHSDRISYPLPSVVFRIFDYTDCPEELPLPGSHAVERYLVEESISRVMDAHYKDRKECANQLLSYYMKGKVPLEHIIVEVILGNLLRLPQPQHIPLFYGSLTIELCKLQPNSFPGVVAHAVELLFDRLDSMNVTCIDRFVDWFTYHLGNFQCKWSWDDWSEFAQADRQSTKVRFIVEVLERCTRMYYRQYVIEKIPESLYSLMPLNPQGNFRYEDPESTDEPGHSTVRSLINAIKSKTNNEGLINIINEISDTEKSFYMLTNDEGNQLDDGTFAPLRVEISTLTILRAGVKSISHTYSALSKFNSIFKSLITSPNGQLQCLFAIREFWLRNPQMLTIVIDKLIRLQIINCSTVVNWIFSKEMNADFTRCYIWVMLHSTLKKMIKHKNKVLKEFKDTKEKMNRLIEKAKKQGDSSSDSGEDSAKEDMNAEIEQKEYETDELSERLENAERDQKELFLILFQRFILVLTEHAVQCEQQQKSKLNSWFRFTLQRLQEIFLTYHSEIQKYEDTLASLLFTTDLESHILEVFQRFKSLTS